VSTRLRFAISGSTLPDFLDYYFQTLGYLASRKDRRAKFDRDTTARDLRVSEYTKEFKSYCGRERVLLRRRRTKLKVDQFHIIAQVGQGGYGEVFLARKQETGEICALKKMKKRTLFKMDEVRRRPAAVDDQFNKSRSDMSL
jgi:cell cycle protein kinase DBF2